MTLNLRIDPAIDRVASKQTNAALRHWLRHWYAIYGARQWPEDAYLLVAKRASWTDAKGATQSAYPSVAQVHVTQWGPAWDAIVTAARETDAYFCVGVQDVPLEVIRASSSSKSPRGLASDLGWVCELHADIDTRDGAHAKSEAGDRDGRPLPTKREALELLGSLPWEPTVIVDTSGGYHAYWVLRAAQPARDPKLREIVERFAEVVIDHFHAAGFAIDENVIPDTNRLLRPAGSWHRKREPQPVKLVHATTRRYSLAEIVAPFPPRPMREVRSSQITVGETGEAERPGDRLALQEGALEHMLWTIYGEGFERVGCSDRWTIPGGSSSDNAVILTSEDDVRRLYVYSDSVAGELGIDDRAWSAFDLLVGHWCGGDPALAARIAARHDADVEQICAAIDGKSLEDLQRLYPARPPAHGQRRQITARTTARKTK